MPASPEQSAERRLRPLLRRFARPDMAEVLRIERRCFPCDPYPERLFLLLQRRDPSLFLVAIEEEGVVGYVIGATESGDGGRIVSIAVDPECRRRGAGTALAREILRRLTVAGASRVELETRIDNEPAIRFWRHLGFRPEGVVEDYYSDGTDALLMARE